MCAPRRRRRRARALPSGTALDHARAPHHRRPPRGRPHRARESAASACRAGAPGRPWPRRRSPLALVRPTARLSHQRQVAEASECLAGLGVGSRRISGFGRASGPHRSVALGPGRLGCPSRARTVAWSRQRQPLQLRQQAAAGTTRTAPSTSWPNAGSASSDGPLDWTDRTLQARPPCQGTIRCPPATAHLCWRPRPQLGWAGCRPSSSSSCSYSSSWHPRHLPARRAWDQVALAATSGRSRPDVGASPMEREGEALSGR